jgi:hypothetical protein
MSRMTTRILLAVLVAEGALPGLWALLFPRSFYDDFPGFGRHWVNIDGPYNEHLVRDVGALQLALAVVALVALVMLTRASLVSAAAGWLVWTVPHLVYHFRHRHAFHSGDAPVVLGGFVAVAIVASLLLARGERERVPAA